MRNVFTCLMSLLPGKENKLCTQHALSREMSSCKGPSRTPVRGEHSCSVKCFIYVVRNKLESRWKGILLIKHSHYLQWQVTRIKCSSSYSEKEVCLQSKNKNWNEEYILFLLRLG